MSDVLSMTDSTWLDRVARDLTTYGCGRWSWVTNGDGSYYTAGWLTSSNGMKIAVQRHGHGRCAFQPCPPTFDDDSGRVRPRHVPMPKAPTVAWGRDPLSVAKDIGRRLLTDYAAARARYEQAVSEARDQLAGKGATETRLKGALDGLYTTHSGQLTRRGMRPSPDFKVSHDGREVDVELRWCPTDLAVDIAELLQRHYESTGDTL